MALVSETSQICINNLEYITNIQSMYWWLLCCNMNYPSRISMPLCNIETDFIYGKSDGIFVSTVVSKCMETSTNNNMCWKLESNTLIRINNTANCTIYYNVDCFWVGDTEYYIMRLCLNNPYQTPQHVNPKNQEI